MVLLTQAYSTLASDRAAAYLGLTEPEAITREAGLYPSSARAHHAAKLTLAWLIVKCFASQEHIGRGGRLMPRRAFSRLVLCGFYGVCVV